MSSTEALTRDALFNLNGRVALVTGGGSGIGLMATQALAANGAKVYITGRTKEKLDRVVSEHFQGNDKQVIPLPADISTKEGIQSLLHEVESREKCLCILVNNAGISGDKTNSEAKTARELQSTLFNDSSFETWMDLYRTNVAAVYFMTAAFLPLLQASSELHKGWSGTAINITSVSGLVQTAQQHFDYSSSKAAAVHLTRMLSSEIAAAGLKIRINGIAPGVFPSEMNAGGSDEKQKSRLPKQDFEGKVPAARPGKDEDMASVILFASCNQYLNGDTLVVDGGFTNAVGK
ncbi:hypothetical protein E4U21_001720 [Claviceps maximensis]|nr:hypothetical protein E4U21_001720 [Claviceps maximensis]